VGSITRIIVEHQIFVPVVTSELPLVSMGRLAKMRNLPELMRILPRSSTVFQLVVLIG
jgi:hypothetical protein